MKSGTLRSKVNKAILLTSAVIAVLFGAILYPFESDRYNTHLKNAHLLVDSVLRQKMEDLANELYADQRRALQASLAEICRVEGIRAAAVYLPDGQHYASTDEDLAREKPRIDPGGFQLGKAFELVSRQNRSFAVFSYAIEVIGMKVGYIRVYYDLSILRRSILLSGAFFATLLLTMILVMSALLNVLLSHLVLQPIAALQRVIRRVDAGQLGETVSMSSRDEIGELGDAFNAMSVKLASSQSALKETEGLYRSIFENASEGIFRSSAEEGRFLTVNPSMARILGYDSPEDILSKVENIADTLYVNPEDRTSFADTLARDGRVIGFETQLYRKDRSTVWVSVSARSILAESGEVVCYEGSLTDMTERREKESAKQESAAAQAASKAKSEFLANMSHEIRTPMNAILGFTDLMDPLITDPMQRSYLESIKISGKGLMALINDILDLSKIEAGKMEIRQGTVSIRELVDEMRSMFWGQMSQKGIELITFIDQSLPDRLMLDGARLRQVLLNLLGNAVKFTDSGGITLSMAPASHRIEEAGCLDLVITVEDTGIGIDPDAHETIFESFAQARGNASHTGSGTGLGLSISKQLIEMMGGAIKVGSLPGQGSRFEITLRDILVVTDEEGFREVEKPIDACSIRDGVKLLVADDLQVNRELIREMLRGHDVTFLEAENGRGAAELAKSSLPDLVLMDIRMPVMDGYEAIEELRRDPTTRMIPVVALTAMGLREERDRILSAGFDSLLIRPFERTELYEIVSRFAGSRPDRLRKEMQAASGEKTHDLPADLTIEKLHGLLESLRSDLMLEWEAARQKQHIPDIESFAAHVRELGMQNSLDCLSRYGEELLFHVDGFDIDKITATLENYPGLVNDIQALGKQRG
jgi:PAS domain S-box-containing protein